jgi:predicted ATP-dependent serine protease
MAAYRCTNCDVNWDKQGECPACGTLTTMLFWAKVDKKETRDQAIQVGKKKAEQVQLQELQVLDPVQKWRWEALKSAGYSDVSALFLATTRAIDLHHAVRLAKQAGPDLAYEILR